MPSPNIRFAFSNISNKPVPHILYKCGTLKRHFLNTGGRNYGYTGESNKLFGILRISQGIGQKDLKGIPNRSKTVF